jgi:SagB-type dehydrogenase family enzyme
MELQMALESKFRIAATVTTEEHEGQFYLFMNSKLTHAPLKFPRQMLEAIETLRADFVSGARLEALITNGADANDLIVRYFYLQSLKKSGFLFERVCAAGDDLIEIIPTLFGEHVSLRNSDKCTLSRFAYLHQEDDALVLETPITEHKIVFVDDRLVQLVALLSKGMSVEEIVGRLSDFDEETILELVEIMASCGFVLSPGAEGALRESEPPLATWEFHDLLFQARSRMGRHCNPSGGTYRFLETIPPLPVVKPAVSEHVTLLQEPDMDALEGNDTPFSYVLENRMSIREFAATPMTLSELGDLLFRAARIKYAQKGDERGDVAFRPYPGGGAIHELEIYPLVQHCEGLDAGLYRYNPKEHQLERVTDVTEDLDNMVWQAAAAMGKPEAKKEINVLLLITSRFPRLSWKYQSMAYATTLKGLGCLYQTLYLVATAMDLAPCAIGAGDSDLFAKASGIDYYAEPLIGEFVIGKPRE